MPTENEYRSDSRGGVRILRAGRLIRSAGAVMVGALIALGVAQTPEPFFEHTIELSHAYGLEMAGQRLRVVEAFEAPIEDDLIEQVEKIFSRDVPRFYGTLLERDAALGRELTVALEAVMEAVEAGENAGEEIAAARPLLERAYETLIPGELRESLTFTAAVMADLLLEDDGVAEAYEDAAEEELWEFPNGWAALQRVDELWRARIEPVATPQQQEDGSEMIEFLGTIYPSPQPPEVITESPEEAEAPAHRLVGILESVTGASLVAGRDLPRLAGHLADTLGPSCEAYSAGNDALGVEGIYAVRNPYRKHLRRLLDLVAPEPHQVATLHLDTLTGNLEDEDEEEDEGGIGQNMDANQAAGPEQARSAGGAVHPAAAASPAEACGQLIDALREAQTALGG